MTTLTLIPRTLLQPSPTNPRKHFDAARQAELHESIKAHGVLQPIVVRAIAGRDGSDGQPLYEIVSGERRWRASEGTAVAECLPCIVGTYDDLQVLELQLVENVQRADLHPLEEAAGYGRLVAAHRTVDEIAAAVGMPRQRVQARLRLLGLTDEARGAFFTGAFGIASALQIARLTTMHQAELCAAMARDAARGAPWAADTIAHHIRSRYTLRLAGAPFALHDATLLPAAGACSACPKRSGANPELFDDITDADTCTDRKCFADKVELHVEHAIDAARARGSQVIQGQEAERLLPTADGTVKGFLRLDRPSEFALSKKPLRELVSPDDREAALIVRSMGEDAPPALVEVMPTPYVRKLLAEKNLLVPDTTTPGTKPKKPRTETKVPAREPKLPKGETKVQQSAAESAAGETLPLAELHPAIADQLDAITVLPAHVDRESKRSPRETERWVVNASARAAALLTINEVAHCVNNDSAHGLPAEGLNNALLRALWDLGCTTDEDEDGLILQALGIDVAWRGTRGAWVESLSDEEAARAVLVLLSLYRGDDGKDDACEQAVAATLGLDMAAINERARAVAEQRLADEQKSASTPAKALAAGKTKPVAAKKPKPPAYRYRNAETGETWSGKGLQPKWLKAALAAGRTLAEFDVAQPAPARKTHTLSPAAAWPFPTDKEVDEQRTAALLLARAREYAIAGNLTTDNAVAAALHIDQPKARKLMEQLEDQGIVGPKHSDGSRDVLAEKAAKKQKAQEAAGRQRIDAKPAEKTPESALADAVQGAQ